MRSSLRNRIRTWPMPFHAGHQFRMLLSATLFESLYPGDFMSTTDALLKEVQAIIAATLGTEPVEIIPTAHWEMDLDGESIDLLDLSFRLEKQLGIKIKIPSPATD